ncbi:MAG: ribose 5-phosphate isomerase B [Bacteriovoracaceae bacterium]|nr:ribose 5-phosphate isomerase B [Bacteriovoracaceae bacterium]
MRWIIGADHAGFSAKESLKKFFQEQLKDEVVDEGTFSEQSCAYPLYATKVCEQVSRDPAARGVLICGTGIGMAMVANRYAHIRAALCQSPAEAQLAREHNDANVLCLGARILTLEQMQEILMAFQKGEFAGGRHQERVALFDSLGEKL